MKDKASIKSFALVICLIIVVINQTRSLFSSPGGHHACSIVDTTTAATNTSSETASNASRFSTSTQQRQERHHERGGGYKGIVLLPASINKFGAAAVLGSSALFKLHGYLPVIIVNQEHYQQRSVPLMDKWIEEHNLCVLSIPFPEPVPEDKDDGTGGQSFLRYSRILVAPHVDEYLERECSITVDRSTFVVVADADLWPVNDLPIAALKLSWELSNETDSIGLQGPVTKGFPWRRRGLCYTAGSIAGWRRYTNATGNLLDDWGRHLVLGRELLQKLHTVYPETKKTTPLCHMDEYILGHQLFVTESHPVVESAYHPRRIGKHFNFSWLHNTTEAKENIFTFDDVHLGHTLKPKILMDVMLRTALSETDVEKYWAVYDDMPA